VKGSFSLHIGKFLFIVVFVLIVEPLDVVEAIENVETQEGHYDDSDNLESCHIVLKYSMLKKIDAKIYNQPKLFFILVKNHFILGKKVLILGEINVKILTFLVPVFHKPPDFRP
jgi:hypothetical protein